MRFVDLGSDQGFAIDLAGCALVSERVEIRKEGDVTVLAEVVTDKDGRHASVPVLALQGGDRISLTYGDAGCRLSICQRFQGAGAAAECRPTDAQLPAAAMRHRDRASFSSASGDGFAYLTVGAGGEANNSGQVLRVPEGGGPAEVLARDQFNPKEVTRAPDGLYWLSSGDFVSPTGVLGLRDGDDTPRVLAPSDFGIDHRFYRVLYADEREIAALAADERPVGSGGSALIVVDTNATETDMPKIVAAYPNDTPYPWAVSDRYLFVALDNGDGRSDRLLRYDRPLATAGAPTVIVPAIDSPSGFVADQSHIYWVDMPDGLRPQRVVRAEHDGGNVEVLATTANEFLSQPVLAKGALWLVGSRDRWADGTMTSVLARVTLAGTPSYATYAVDYAAHELRVGDGPLWVIDWVSGENEFRLFEQPIP